MSNLHLLKAKTRAAEQRARMAVHKERSAIARAAIMHEVERLSRLSLTWIREEGEAGMLYPVDLRIAALLAEGLNVEDIAVRTGILPAEIWPSIMRLL